MLDSKRKKLIIIVIAILLLLSLVTILITILRARERYTGEPILQETLQPNDFAPIDVESLKIDKGERYTIWGLSTKVSVDQIQDMIFGLNLNLTLEDEIEGSYYRWQDTEGNHFQYSLLGNTLVFSLQEGIPWNEASLTSRSFTNFVQQYFNTTWEYEVTESISFSNQETLFYAKRLTRDGYPIERTPNLYQETDYLILKNGRITSGEIFLTHFFDTDITLPLLTERELSTYVNNSNYPKTVNMRPDHIAEALGMYDDYAYMNMEIIELQQQVDRCEANNYSVVYLYTSFEQEFLTPVYRLGMECILEYRGEEYSVPAVGYVSAVDPQYITVPE